MYFPATPNKALSGILSYVDHFLSQLDKKVRQFLLDFSSAFTKLFGNFGREFELDSKCYLLELGLLRSQLFSLARHPVLEY